MNCLVLWDIDHTLIDDNGVSKAIYLAAFEALVNRPAQVLPITEGRTDQLIMRDLFVKSGVPEQPGWPEVQEALAAAGREHSEVLRRTGSVLPGVRNALRALAGVQGVVQGVLTGNIRDNALVKLSAFDLDSLVDLDAGAYGSDHEDRAVLVSIAERRAAKKATLELMFGETVLVGDTPQDVDAALLSGARMVGVASGIYSESDLTAAGAPVVLPSLEDTSRVVAAVTNTTPSGR
jgi:phosphoglycolate phosphatase-like HAD superfamily hydrolase